MAPYNIPAMALGTPIILASQFFPRPGHSPEQKLLMAVLQDAALILTSTSSAFTLRNRQAEARAWIAAEDWVWPCSFLRICEALDLDSTAVRRDLTTRDAVKKEKKRGPFGEILPPGIQLNSMHSRECAYRVTTFAQRKAVVHAFATLAEAVAFRSLHQPPPPRGARWGNRPVHVAKKPLGACSVCPAPITRGDAYRSSGGADQRTAIHESCWQAQYRPAA